MRRKIDSADATLHAKATRLILEQAAGRAIVIGLRRLNRRTQFDDGHHRANLVYRLYRVLIIAVGMKILQGMYVQAADSAVAADMRMHQRRRDLQQHEQDQQNRA